MAQIFGTLAVGLTTRFLLGLFAPSQNTESPRLDDLSAPKSEYGAPIPAIYGQYRVGGNIIWAEDIKEHKKKKRSGKGGGATNTTYSYTGCFAALLCEGEVDLIRVWLNGTLAYNVENTSRDGQKLNERFLDSCVFMSGSQSQTPITRMQQRDGVNLTPAYRGYAYLFFQDMPLNDYGNSIPQVSAEVRSKDTSRALVKNCVASICKKAGLSDDQFSVADIEDSTTFIGFALNQSGATYREYLEQLQQIYQFYCLPKTRAGDAGKNIRFVPYDKVVSRTGVSDFNSDTTGLNPNEQSDEGAIIVERTNESELPSKVVISHINPAKSFDKDSFEVSASRIIDIDNAFQVSSDLAIEVDKAKTAAIKLLSQIHARKDTYKFKIPSFTHVDFNAGDVIEITVDGLSRVPIQVQKIVYGLDFSAEVTGTFFSSFAGRATIAPQPVRPTPPSSYYGEIDAILADTALIKAGEDALGIYVAAYTPSRMGESQIQVSINGGASYENVGTISDVATTGKVINLLPAAIPDLIDRANKITVVLDSGTLSSVPQDAFLQKQNLALVGKELIAFKNAVAIAPNTYELSELIRYCNGTEGEMYLHEADEPFLLLLGDGASYFRLTGSQANFNNPILVRIIEEGGFTATPASIIPKGLGVKPTLLANVRAYRDEQNEIQIRWFRTSHLGDQWIDGAETATTAPDETTFISIVAQSNPSAAPKVYTTKQAAFIYTSAMQISDFGSNVPVFITLDQAKDGTIHGYATTVKA